MLKKHESSLPPPMAGMTPERPVQRKRPRSPLQEMDANVLDDDELVGPEKKSERSVPPLDAIAAIVQARQEIQTALAPVETSLTNMGEGFGVRIRTLESQVAKQSTQLEGFMAANGPGTTTLCELDDKLAEL